MSESCRIRSAIITLSRQEGVAVIEVALTIPVLLVVLLFTADMSRAFYQYNTLTKSVQDGSRYLAQNALTGNVAGSLSSSVMSDTRNLVVSGYPNGGSPILNGLSADNVTIAIETVSTSDIPRHYVTVAASYSYQPLTPLLNSLGFLSSNVDFGFQLTAQSSMRAH